MSRTIIFLVFFVALGGVLYFLLSKEKEQNQIGWDRAFAIEEIDAIGTIFIADRKGNRTKLERKAGYWLYNETFRANPNAIENVLDAISRIEMKFKPANAAVPNMVASLASNGLKVEILDRNGRELKAYYIGGSTPDERGTYMIMEDAEQPYVCFLPGWEGNLRFRFNLVGDQWRDKTVFSLQPERLKAIEILYPKQQSKSFRLVKDGAEYQLYPLFGNEVNQMKKINSATGRRFLAGFDWLAAESFANKYPKKDSILQTVPFCSIKVEKIDGKTQEVHFYPVQGNAPIDLKTMTTLGNSVIERFLIDKNKEDFMLVQNRVFRKIFWAYEFFLE